MAATSTPPTPPRPPVTTVDEAEAIAKEYVAKKFGPQDLQTITTAFTASYSIFTVSLERKVEHRREVRASGSEETPPHNEAHAGESQEASHHSEVHSPSWDVWVDKNGLVVACTRIVRTAREAEAIAREYVMKRHGLTHFVPYTTTFDGSYYTVYGGGLVYEGGLVRSALKVYKSKFYDVKLDKTGLIVGWTTEGLVTHYSKFIQKFR